MCGRPKQPKGRKRRIGTEIVGESSVFIVGRIPVTPICVIEVLNELAAATIHSWLLIHIISLLSSGWGGVLKPIYFTEGMTPLAPGIAIMC